MGGEAEEDQTSVPPLLFASYVSFFPFYLPFVAFFVFQIFIAFTPFSLCFLLSSPPFHLCFCLCFSAPMGFCLINPFLIHICGKHAHLPVRWVPS
jgi:hypothetical protein